MPRNVPRTSSGGRGGLVDQQMLEARQPGATRAPRGRTGRRTRRHAASGPGPDTAREARWGATRSRRGGGAGRVPRSDDGQRGPVQAVGDRLGQMRAQQAGRLGGIAEHGAEQGCRAAVRGRRPSGTGAVEPELNRVDAQRGAGAEPACGVGGHAEEVRPGRCPDGTFFAIVGRV